MALMGEEAGTFRLAFRIDLQHDLRDFSPVSAVCVCIKHTHVGDHMLAVVGGSVRSARYRVA